MRNGSFGLVVGALVVALVALMGSAFVVNPTRQALVLQFGQVKRAIVEPGLYFKIPLIQNVEYLDRRILDLDLDPQEVIAADQKRLIVDAFARYKIVDPVAFYQAVRTVQSGNQRLTTFVSSGLRAVLADATLTAIVRDERAPLMERLKKQVQPRARDFGVEIVDVRIRRADLPDTNAKAIFGRMQKEREREATEIRARGGEESQRIKAKANQEREIILAEANRDADKARGEGDALRIKIFADAFGRDADFFAFYRSMQAYEAALKSGDTKIVISPSTSDFFRYFADPAGEKKNTLPPVPAPLPAGPAPTAAPAQ